MVVMMCWNEDVCLMRYHRDFCLTSCSLFIDEVTLIKHSYSYYHFLAVTDMPITVYMTSITLTLRLFFTEDIHNDITHPRLRAFDTKYFFFQLKPGYCL